MSIRTFIFCDYCNQLGVRMVDNRRQTRDNGCDGRRFSDGRSWFEGREEEAIEECGWTLTAEGFHACPRCIDRGLPAMAPFGERASS